MGWRFHEVLAKVIRYKDEEEEEASLHSGGWERVLI